MLSLKGLEQALEVACAEAIEVLPLDDLDKHSWTVDNMLCEDLQKIAALVKIDQNIVLLQHVDVLGDLHTLCFQLLSYFHVIDRRNLEEADAARLQVAHGRDDIVRAEGDMLAAGTVVVVDESGAHQSATFTVGDVIGFTHSDIWDCFNPFEGSFMGILTTLSGDATTTDLMPE